MEVMVLQTGAANLASVLAALRRAGASPVLGVDPERAARADRLVLPGVGAFGQVMDRLDETTLRQVLQARIAADRPLLGICLGMQVLATGSDESPGVAGLGVLPGRVTPFGDVPIRPLMGWGAVRGAPCGLVRDGEAYFVHGFRLTEAPADWQVSWADYGGPYVAALQRGSVLGCQFHPELSGSWGASLLRRWLQEVPCT